MRLDPPQTGEAEPPELRLAFEGGTLLLEPPGALGDREPPPGFRPDPRAGDRLRAPALAYRRALTRLLRDGWRIDDRARGYESLELVPRREREPFPHQREALEAWAQGGRAGVVVLPTGAGKSYVAELAIARVQRSTLVVAPTIDLMTQWMNLLGAAFGEELVGGLGGGLHDVRPLTATTYDSAFLHLEHLGDRFGMLVFDECHHLPSASYGQAAECAIAPFRLGLTATPERPDGGHERLPELIGPTVYRRDIQDMAGDYLADYEVVRLRVQLDDDEREAYDRARADYRGFVEACGIRMSSPEGWGRFLALSSRSRRGRQAWHAWRRQREIALRSRQKLRLLQDLLRQHRRDRVLIFTSDNETVYAIARRHLIPPITHQTPAAERRRILAGFNAGELPAIVTSRVLNEGVDLPTANVGIVLSGSSSVREHVQRLGRLLRKGETDSAMLYEVITEATAEEVVSERRREHGAYR